MNYKDQKNSELTENQLDFLTAFTEGVPLHVIYHWIRSNMHIYIQNNKSNLAIEKIISVKNNGIAIEAFIPTTVHSENTFCSTYDKLYTFFILDEMKDKCVEGLEEFEAKQHNAEEKNLWLEKYKERSTKNKKGEASFSFFIIHNCCILQVLKILVVLRVASLAA